MDANKLAELKQLAYTIPQTCGLCRHGQFPNDDWGTCEIHTYAHQKHTAAQRHLSIYKGGTCAKFEANYDTVLALGAFAEFIEGAPIKNDR